MDQDTTVFGNKNPEELEGRPLLRTNKPSPEATDTGEGPRVLGLSLEDVTLSGWGTMSEELIERLESAAAGFPKASNSFPIPILEVPGHPYGTVYDFSYDRAEFDLTAAGMGVKLTRHKDISGTRLYDDHVGLTMHAGPHTLDQSGLAELKSRIRTVNALCLDDVSGVHLERCAVAAYFGNSPDSLEDIVSNAVTQARRKRIERSGGTVSHIFGSIEAGRQVKVSVHNGQYMSVKLVFHEAFIMKLDLLGKRAGSNLSHLVRDLARTTLGGGVFPPAFFRVVHKDFRDRRPTRWRQDILTWVILRRALLEAVSEAGDAA